MKNSILDLVKNKIILLDGAIGTELIRQGLSPGTCPELWNIEKPDIIQDLHQKYFVAGSDVVLTNSFGGNEIKLSSYNLEGKCHEINYAAAKLAHDIKPEGKYVGGSIGPTGKFLKPQGTFTETDFEKAFASQAKSLSMGKVDFLLIETMYDLKEALCALRGARSSSHLPVFITMTFNIYPRGFFTLMGNSINQCVEELKANNVPVMGANCTLDSLEMANLIKKMRELTSLPLIAKPNSGRPILSSNNDVSYSQSREDFLLSVPKIINNGANLIGGCCGTNASYIERMAEIIKNN